MDGIVYERKKEIFRCLPSKCSGLHQNYFFTHLLRSLGGLVILTGRASGDSLAGAYLFNAAVRTCGPKG